MRKAIEQITRLCMPLFLFFLYISNINAQEFETSYELTSRRTFINQPVRLTLSYKIMDYDEEVEHSYQLKESDDFVSIRPLGESPSMRDFPIGTHHDTRTVNGVPVVSYKVTYHLFLVPTKAGLIDLPHIEVNVSGSQEVVKPGKVFVINERVEYSDSLAFRFLNEEYIDLVFFNISRKTSTQINGKRQRTKSTLEAYFEPLPEEISLKDTIPIKVVVPNKGFGSYTLNDFIYSGFKAKHFYILDASKELIPTIDSGTLLEQKKEPTLVSRNSRYRKWAYFYLVPRKKGKLRVDLGQFIVRNGKVKDFGTIKVKVKK